MPISHQMTETETKTLQPLRKIRRKNIDEGIILTVAKSVAKGLTETEAVVLQGIKPQAWFDFKTRNRSISSKYAETLSRVRASFHAHQMEQIDKAADGRDGVRHDWRAALCRLQMSDRERFSTQPSQQPATVNNTAITLAVGGEERLRKLVESCYQNDAKALPAPSESTSANCDTQVVETKQIK